MTHTIKIKIKKLFFLSLLITIFSCSGPGGNYVYNGFRLSSLNHTSKELDAKLIIGGFLNGNFIPTDSVLISNIKRGGTSPLPMFFDENKWKPDLEKIRVIPSEKCYFKIKLSNGREEFVIKYNTNEILGLKLPVTDWFEGDYGDLYLIFYEDKVAGNIREE